MSKATCSDHLAESLIASGVDYVVGIPGHGNIVFADAVMARQGRLPWILVRHEQSAAHMADGYFRASGRPLAIATSIGPGAMNTLIGVATAYVDSSAMIVITGAAPSYLFDKGCLQELDRQTAADFPTVMRPLVKRSWQVTRPDQMGTVSPQLIKVATTGRPGPVHLDFPMDVQAMPCPSAVDNLDHRVVASRIRPDAEAVVAAAELLASAERPLILAGGGVIHAGADSELRSLAEYIAAPVVTSLHGKGAIPDDHSLAGGTVGSKGTDCANQLARSADVILAVGSRFGEWDTSSWQSGATFSIPPTRLIHIDIDHTQIAKNYPTEVGLWADAKAALSDILNEVQARTGQTELADSDWVANLVSWRKQWRLRLDSRAEFLGDITTTLALRELRLALPREAVVVGAAGHAQGQMFQEWETYGPRTHISSSHFSTMGFALPAAIGAKLALPSTPVIAIMGDGDFQQSLPELATARQYGISVIAVVLNNGGLLSVRDLQIDALKSDRFEATEFRIWPGTESSNPDFIALASAYGVPAARAETPSEIGPLLVRLLEGGGPGLLEIPTASAFPQSDGIKTGYFEMPVPSN